MSKGIKTVFGGAGIGPERYFKDEPTLEELYDILEKGGVSIIDTAQLYAVSEELLGKTGAPNRFTIDSKAKGGFGGQGTATEEAIIKGGEETMATLKTDKLDIFYLHSPDHETPLSSTLAGINTLYKRGYFSRFGLSNYKAEDVRAVYSHCKENNYVLPSVYQGNYSAVARLQETVLLPTLRELNMAFYSYSPLAGGFLTKSAKQIQDGAGRFDKSTPIGSMYFDMYGAKTSYLEALEQWGAIADEEGCSRAALAYRWVKYNSPLKPDYGDAIIFGASSLAQVENTLKDMEAGPLSDKAVKGIDAVWEKIKHEAPLDNFHK